MWWLKIRGIVSSGQKLKSKSWSQWPLLIPLPVGLLIILMGKLTKRTQEFTKLDKTYDVSMKLGEHSTTGDPEGKKSVISSAIPAKLDIETALKKLSGEQMQRPPVFSAIKINGQRSYDLARAGKAVKLARRSVTIYDNELLEYKYPLVPFTSHVSSGTYIRSLVEDIGEVLSVGAYTTDLRRTKIGHYDIKDAISVLKCSSTEISKRLLTIAENKN